MREVETVPAKCPECRIEFDVNIWHPLTPKVRYYKTDFQFRDEDRYEMIADMISKDVALMGGLKPRVLHVADRNYQHYRYLSVIVVWE